MLLFQQTGGLKQATGEGVGLEMNPTFFWSVVRAILIGDALNALGYRLRPYEVEPGATDRAIEVAKRHISTAFETSASIPMALYRAREQLTLLGFAPCKIGGMPGFRYQLPAGYIEVCSTIHTDGTTMRVSWMVTLYRHSTRGWSEMRTIGEDLDALGPGVHPSRAGA